MSTGRLISHFERFLGTGREAESVGPVGLWVFTRDEFVTVATVGLSGQPVTAVVPQELVCSVLPDQVGAAHYLVTQCLQMVLAAGTGLANDQIIPNDGVLLAGTEITGVLVGAHPFLDDDFDVLGTPGGPDVVELMTLIPVTQPEIDLASGDGVDALLERLERQDPPLLDVTRPPAW